MAANVLTGDWNSNSDNFRDEFEDYALATGQHEKPNEFQAATEELNGQRIQAYLPAQSHTQQQCDAKAMLDALDNYFRPTRNVIYEQFDFGSCKQKEGESVNKFVTHLRERSATC